MIRRQHGYPLTYSDAAALIRAEGELYAGGFFSNGGRCLWGVLEEWDESGRTNPVSVETYERLARRGFGTVDNDRYVGTPAERAEHFARMFEALGEEPDDDDDYDDDDYDDEEKSEVVEGGEMVEFTDGTVISFAEAARLIRQENRLYTGCYCDKDGRRCLWGVLEGWGLNSQSRQVTPESARVLIAYRLSAMDSDAYVGTPEERAEYFARKFEDLAKEGR